MPKRSIAHTSLPPRVQDHLQSLGNNIRLARKRREYSQEHLAGMAYVTRDTIRRLESGHPGVSLGVLVTVLWVLQLDESLSVVGHPDHDRLGLALDRKRLPERVRMKDKGDDYDF